ncbi:hypothetical protein LTR17_019191 [Elasticomyces elasticus]|nr:hypothetical protein LTR17_019191 [Elasticomyces elasticus]
MLATIAQALAHTDPHRDSVGFGTFLSWGNGGGILFGWLDKTTDEVLKSWKEDPTQPPRDAEYRIVALRPGQTVYLPPGLVHLVCRTRANGNTLLYGGHILRPSDMRSWLDLVVDLEQFPDTTNEDSDDANPYILAGAQILSDLRPGSAEDAWGGP